MSLSMSTTRRLAAVLVSELVPGETLAELEATGDLCDRDVAEIVADLC